MIQYQVSRLQGYSISSLFVVSIWVKLLCLILLNRAVSTSSAFLSNSIRRFPSRWAGFNCRDLLPFGSSLDGFTPTDLFSVGSSFGWSLPKELLPVGSSLVGFFLTVLPWSLSSSAIHELTDAELWVLENGCIW